MDTPWLKFYNNGISYVNAKIMECKAEVKTASH